MVQSLLHFFFKYGFFVASRLADCLGMRATNVRLFFIYASFLAVGFPILIYLLAAIVLDIRSYVKKIRLRVWDI